MVLHTAEGAKTNTALFNYFNATQIASCHAGIDDADVSDGWVDYTRAAWTLQNGNAYSDNAEICGFASWSRAEWLAHPEMLNGAAAWVRARCHARGIPLIKLSPTDVKAGKAGVCGHIDYTNATGDGSHWDPGPHFPWDIVIDKARNGAPSGGRPTPNPPKPTPAPEDEDDDMPFYPKEIAPSMKESFLTLPWDGREAVLNVTPTRSIVFIGKPLNWGPGGGTGGGDSTVARINPSRVEVNQPGQYRIPAGTTRIFYSYSCATTRYVWAKSVSCVVFGE